MLQGDADGCPDEISGVGVMDGKPLGAHLAGKVTEDPAEKDRSAHAFSQSW